MDLTRLRWTEHPDNPLIHPLGRGWMIADPTLLLPEETPDGRWHLFANSIPPRLHHFTSVDGEDWSWEESLCRGGMRPWCRRIDGEYLLVYERVHWVAPLRSRIELIRSSDLTTWSAPVTLLSPSLPWHGRFHRTVSCPSLYPWEGGWRMVYSAATVFLRDCGFVEPRFIGVADAPAPEGPWVPRSEPILGPSRDDWFRTLGAGSLKVIPDPDGDGLWGFGNGIYRDGAGRSRSSIGLFRSADGLAWEWASEGPVISPGGTGWKRALVYAMDVRITGPDAAVMVFNARDGWFVGAERIGMATATRSADLPVDLEARLEV